MSSDCTATTGASRYDFRKSSGLYILKEHRNGRGGVCLSMAYLVFREETLQILEGTIVRGLHESLKAFVTIATFKADGPSTPRRVQWHHFD